MTRQNTLQKQCKYMGLHSYCTKLFYSLFSFSHFTQFLSCCLWQRWSKAFRSGEVNIVAGTTNGIESQHKIFKTSYLHRKTTFGLYHMLLVLINEFFPSRYRAYVHIVWISLQNYNFNTETKQIYAFNQTTL